MGGSGIGGFGGICGQNTSGEISKSYSMGAIVGGESAGFVGGICGENDGVVDECYSTVVLSGGEGFYNYGGVCGEDYSGSINVCFWDTQTSGIDTSAGGIGKTTAQMKTQSTFSDADWDFSSGGTWRMSGLNSDFSGYPVLSFQPEENDSPDRPAAVSPSAGARGVHVELSLNGTAYSDPDGDAHANSHWQVDDHSNFSSPEWDSGVESDPYTWGTLPQGRLTTSTLYYWRVRYKDNRGAWSEWSEVSTFTTVSLVQVMAPDSGGSITPSGDLSAGTDLSVTLTAIPDGGFKVTHWLVNGEITASGQSELVLNDIAQNLTVEVVFERVKAMPWLNLLLDDEESSSDSGGDSGNDVGDDDSGETRV